MKKIFTLSAIATATLLTGCASTIQAEKFVKDNNTNADQTYQGAKIKTTPAVQDDSRDSKGNFAKVSKNWVNPNPLPRYDIESAKARVPGFFQDRVALTMPGKVSLVEVLSELQRAKKIKFIINQDVYNSTVGTGSLVSGTSSAAPAATATAAPQGASLMSLGTNSAVPVYINDFVFRGTLEEALDLMSSKANIAWKWNGSAIEVYRFETKNYALSALAGKTTTSANVSMAGSASTAGGAGTTTSANSNGVVRTSDITTWDDVKAYLMTLTSKDGKIAVMESSGIITVKDTPMVQATIEKAMKELNDNLGKQIYMDVKIFSVAMTDGDNYGLDWNLAWAQAASRYGISLSGAGAGLNTSSPISIGTSITSGPFSGTSATLKALSSIGKTSIVNEFTVSTLNGQTTPIGNTTKQDYVKQVKVTVTGTGTGSQATTSVEVTPDSVYDGLNMSVTPKLQKDLDKILLEYALTLNTIDDMSQTYTDSTGNKVTLPKTSIKNILQRSALRSGQTLVLSGFKQNTAKIQNDGVGSANFQLLGGGRNSANTSQYLVITVTPYVAQE